MRPPKIITTLVPRSRALPRSPAAQVAGEALVGDHVMPSAPAHLAALQRAMTPVRVGIGPGRNGVKQAKQQAHVGSYFIWSLVRKRGSTPSACVLRSMKAPPRMMTRQRTPTTCLQGMGAFNGSAGARQPMGAA